MKKPKPHKSKYSLRRYKNTTIYHVHIFNFYIIKLENSKKENPARIYQFKSTERTINHLLADP